MATRDFDAEFAVANRGIMELNEILKMPKDFLQSLNPCHEIPLGVQGACVLPGPYRKRKKILRSIDDDWES